jgi:hypothetical protein
MSGMTPDTKMANKASDLMSTLGGAIDAAAEDVSFKGRFFF